VTEPREWSARSGDDAAARPDGPPRPAAPAPVPEQVTAVFGRPDGVTGSFSPEAAPADRPQPQLADPDPVLAEAFARPAGSSEGLQRDPYATFGREDADPEPADPWRDPDSGAFLDGPALTDPQTEAPTVAGPKLGLRELLFGGRVHWWALASLAMVALLVGLIGGLMGRWTAEAVPPLNADTVSLNVDDSAASSDSPIAQVAKEFAPAVVMIEVRTAAGGGTGSGFVIDKLGYIVTNNHVVSMAATDKSAKLEVVFSDHHRVPARVVGRDPKTDLAVVKVDDVENLKVAEFGSSSKLEIGQQVIAFGAPLGLDRTVTTGIVSAMGRAVPLRPDAESDTDTVVDAIQTDAAINPGNSGGPLVDGQGRVVGVNTAIASGAGGSIGLGFAIPSDEAVPVVERLIKDGKINHPQIGITADTVRNDKVYGARIKDVVAGGPGAAAGLKENDVITGFDGRTIEGADELTVAVRTSKIGKQVKITYWRDGRTFDGEITPRSD